MKQLFLSCFLTLFSSSLCMAQEGLYNILPEKIQDYVNSYFPDQKVVKYKSEITLETAKYKIFIGNDIAVTFDENFQPIILDGTMGLPENVIPVNVFTYVKKYFPDNKIQQWQKRVINQTVSLDDGTKIKFDSEGNFIRMKRS